ncbi:H-2 class II histocompatibility antigen, E-D beta chain-like isoform 2-T2 [Aulostomus maculatus]
MVSPYVLALPWTGHLPLPYALYGHGLLRCQFASSDGHDAVYLEQIYFNKVLLCQYNSTLGKYVSYIESLQKVIDDLNKNPALLKSALKNTETCKSSIPQVYDALSKARVEPYVRLRSEEAIRGRSKTLICSVYNFYPKHINVTWQINGKEVTSNVTSSDVLPRGNWLYQIHTHLHYTPTLTDRVSCVVEHSSLTEPKIYDWELESVRNKIALGTTGLLLGLVFFSAGLIYYRRNDTGRVRVPNTPR